MNFDPQRQEDRNQDKGGSDGGDGKHYITLAS